MGSENRKHNRFRLCGGETHTNALFFFLLFQHLPEAVNKNTRYGFFDTATLPSPPGARLTEHGSLHRLEGVYSTERRVVGGSFESRR